MAVLLIGCIQTRPNILLLESAGNSHREEESSVLVRGMLSLKNCYLLWKLGAISCIVKYIEKEHGNSAVKYESSLSIRIFFYLVFIHPNK